MVSGYPALHARWALDHAAEELFSSHTVSQVNDFLGHAATLKLFDHAIAKLEARIG